MLILNKSARKQKENAMKRVRISVAILLCAVLACGLFLSACTGTVTEVSEDVEAAAIKSASDYLKDYVKANLSDYAFDGEATQIDAPAKNGTTYVVKGVLALKKGESDTASADFTLKMELLNYVGQTKATFRMLDAQVSAPR